MNQLNGGGWEIDNITPSRKWIIPNTVIMINITLLKRNACGLERIVGQLRNVLLTLEGGFFLKMSCNILA